MSDFHQSGPVTALPRLLARPVEDLESRKREPEKKDELKHL